MTRGVGMAAAVPPCFLAPMLCVGAHTEHAPRAMHRLACLTLSSLIHQLGGTSAKRYFRRRAFGKTCFWEDAGPVHVRTPTHWAPSGTRRSGWPVWPDMADGPKTSARCWHHEMDCVLPRPRGAMRDLPSRGWLVVPGSVSKHRRTASPRARVDIRRERACGAPQQRSSSYNLNLLTRNCRIWGGVGTRFYFTCACVAFSPATPA